MSSNFESGSYSEDNAHSELQAIGGVQPAAGAALAPALIPFERRFKVNNFEG
jgi:hypothetical protein